MLRLALSASRIAVQCGCWKFQQAFFLSPVGIVAVYIAPASIASILLPLLGMVLQGSSSITYGSIASFVQEQRRPRGFAAIYTMSSGASIAGPLVFGLVGDVFHIDTAIWSMALVTLLVLPLYMLLHTSVRRLSVRRVDRADPC
ncbi:MAG: hypothetical protein QF435_11545 [Arenicellales bacterium]|nr:hypothetical protein [Arenicellales bacterium]